MKPSQQIVPAVLIGNDEDCKEIAIRAGVDLAAMAPEPPQNIAVAIFRAQVQGHDAHCALMKHTTPGDSGYAMIAVPFDIMDSQEFVKFALSFVNNPVKWLKHASQCQGHAIRN